MRNFNILDLVPDTAIAPEDTQFRDVNGVNLADYLTEARESGIVPSFTNIPGAAGNGLDTFVLPTPTRTISDARTDDSVRLGYLQNVIELDPKYSDPTAVSDYNTANNIYNQLQLDIKDGVRRLEYARGEEIGLPELRERIGVLKDSPVAQSNPDMINSLIDQYNAKQERVRMTFDDPDTKQAFDELESLQRKWAERRDVLAQQQQFETKLEQGLETNEALSEQDAARAVGGEANVARMAEYARIPATAMVDQIQAKSAKAKGAQYLVQLEDRLKRKVNVADVFNADDGSATEKEAIEMLLQKMDPKSARDLKDNVINEARRLIPAQREVLKQELVDAAIQRELDIQNSTRKPSEHKTKESLSFEDRNKIAKTVSDEASKMAESQAGAYAYQEAMRTYKHTLIQEGFRDGMSLKGNSRYSLEVQEASEQLIRDYPDAFTYPVNPNEAQQAQFTNQWRKIAATYNGEIPLQQLVNSMTSNVIQTVNGENGKRMPDGEPVLNAKDPAIFAIYRSILTGQRDAQRMIPFVNAASFYGDVGMAALAPADILQVIAAKAQQEQGQ